MGKKILVISLALLLATGLAACGSDDDGPTEPPGNSDPPVPAIDEGAGAPAHGAADVTVTADLHWTCTDPDGDALTYTVHFGTATDPAVVATDHAARTYDPGTLAHATTYYWRVAADDGGGGTSESAVWNFTTAASQTTETISTPGSLGGPGTGVTGVSYDFSPSGAVSSQGHALAYQYTWGDGTTSTWSTDVTVSHVWIDPGSYTILLRARCIEHPTVISSHASALMVIEQGAEIVSTPGVPSGRNSGITGEMYTYSGFSATSSLGDAVEYRVDWDDGDVTDWGPYTTINHAWDNPGTYDIRAQARCKLHPEVVSAWSDPRTVTITQAAAETVTTPVLSGPTSGVTTLNVNFTTTSCTSSLGHQVEYVFDWGDGTSNVSGSGLRGHLYGTPGTYQVTAFARCREHQEVESAVSNVISITITEP